MSSASRKMTDATTDCCPERHLLTRPLPETRLVSAFLRAISWFKTRYLMDKVLALFNVYEYSKRLFIPSLLLIEGQDISPAEIRLFCSFRLQLIFEYSDENTLFSHLLPSIFHSVFQLIFFLLLFFSCLQPLVDSVF